MPDTIPFTQRLGINLSGPPIDADVPESARIGLINLLSDLVDRHYIDSWWELESIVLYVGRRLKSDFSVSPWETTCIQVIQNIEWPKFYTLCERVYKLLHGATTRDEQGTLLSTGPIEEAREYYTYAINQLMGEENLAYEFTGGIFQLRGRPQTQKSMQRAGAVLADPRLAPVRSHYNKAVKFYRELSSPDVRNCVKECICAFEACVELLFADDTEKDFLRVLRLKQGNGEGQVPPALIDGMIKLRAFRGDAQGVAHASLQGGVVTAAEAELVLSLTASYITYLNDKFPDWCDDLPF